MNRMQFVYAIAYLIQFNSYLYQQHNLNDHKYKIQLVKRLFFACLHKFIHSKKKKVEKKTK